MESILEMMLDQIEITESEETTAKYNYEYEYKIDQYSKETKDAYKVMQDVEKHLENEYKELTREVIKKLAYKLIKE